MAEMLRALSAETALAMVCPSHSKQNFKIPDQMEKGGYGAIETVAQCL
jgi:hypothetical protein